MAISHSDLSILLEKWRLQQASEMEVQQLWTLLQDPEQEKAIVALLQEIYEQTPADKFFSTNQKQQLLKKAIRPWDQQFTSPDPVHNTVNTGKRRKLKPFRIAAAAILLLGVTYFLTQIVFSPKSNSANLGVQGDIMAPQTEQATLSFGDGASSITLKDSGSGILGQQQGLQLIRQNDGRLVLKGAVDHIIQSKLSVPKGSQPIHLELPDGSQVWVNAGSSLRFPNQFSGRERKVALQGEAYFEVAHLTKKPFLVSQGTNTVRVLGTHFNINGYHDEPTVKVTLLAGKVSVNQALTIQPGQQAIIDKEDRVTLNAHPDLAEAMSWKNNEFIFNKADVPAILRQLSRWYDLEIIYKNKIPTGHYSGSISRDNNLSQVLSILQTGGLKFIIQKKQLIVL